MQGNAHHASHHSSSGAHGHLSGLSNIHGSSHHGSSGLAHGHAQVQAQPQVHIIKIIKSSAPAPAHQQWLAPAQQQWVAPAQAPIQQWSAPAQEPATIHVAEPAPAQQASSGYNYPSPAW